MTKKGKQGFLGKISHGFTAINRFFKNNLTDDSKHEAIDMLLGIHSKSLVCKE